MTARRAILSTEVTFESGNGLTVRAVDVLGGCDKNIESGGVVDAADFGKSHDLWPAPTLLIGSQRFEWDARLRRQFREGVPRCVSPRSQLQAEGEAVVAQDALLCGLGFSMHLQHSSGPEHAANSSTDAANAGAQSDRQA